jgi:uncharacterized membrane protein YdjX (TVP38/TMEM64 family)
VRNPKKTISFLAVVVILLSVFAVLYPFITNPTSVSNAYASAGAFAPVVFILLVIVAPTPGAIVGASGGAYFGIWEGALYLFIGNLIGVCLTFLLVQHFGRPAAQRFFKEEKLRQYEGFADRHPYLPWFIYAFPIFPIELMTFVIALSGKKFKQFFLTVVTALPLYAIFVTTIGYYLSDRYKQLFDYASIVILVIIVYAVVHFLYTWKREEIHETGRKIRKQVVKQVGNIEKQVDKFASATRRMGRKKR